MTTWDMDTVHRVRDLGQTVRVDRAVLAAARADVFEAVRQKAAGQIVEAARTFAVEVHPDDVQAFEVTRADDHHHSALICVWRPGWRDVDVEVELRGGAADGTLFTFRRDQLHNGVVLHKPMPSLNLADVDQIGPTRSLLSGTEHYQLAGWREAERRWVLACE